MSGGALDYNGWKLDGCIEQINERISKNGKTVQQIWDAKSKDEKEISIECGHIWEQPWTTAQHPYYVEDIAESEAWDKVGVVEKVGSVLSRSLPTKKMRDEWNRLRKESILSQIKNHNNAIEHQVWSDKTISKIQEMLKTIKLAKKYLRQIDYLMSGDTDEEDWTEPDEND